MLSELHPHRHRTQTEMAGMSTEKFLNLLAIAAIIGFLVVIFLAIAFGWQGW